MISESKTEQYRSKLESVMKMMSTIKRELEVKSMLEDNKLQEKLHLSSKVIKLCKEFLKHSDKQMSNDESKSKANQLLQRIIRSLKNYPKEFGRIIEKFGSASPPLKLETKVKKDSDKAVISPIPMINKIMKKKHDVRTSSRNNERSRRGTQYSINVSQVPEYIKERQNGDESGSSSSSESNYKKTTSIVANSIPDNFQIGSFNSIDQSGSKVMNMIQDQKTLNKTISPNDIKQMNFSFNDNKEKSIHLEEIKEFDAEIESRESRLKKKRVKREKIFSNPPSKKPSVLSKKRTWNLFKNKINQLASYKLKEIMNYTRNQSILKNDRKSIRAKNHKSRQVRKEENKSPLETINSMLIIKEKIKSSKPSQPRKSSKMTQDNFNNQPGRSIPSNPISIVKRPKLRSQVPHKAARDSKRIMLPKLSNISNDIMSRDMPMNSVQSGIFEQSLMSGSMSPTSHCRVKSPALKMGSRLDAINIDAQTTEWKKLTNKFTRRKRSKLITGSTKKERNPPVNRKFMLETLSKMQQKFTKNTLNFNKK